MPIQAHGGGIIKVDDTFYWVGEDKTGGWPFSGINCYSSKNLVEWTFVKAIFTLQTKGEFGPGRVVERPKIIYHSANKTYVMWMHIDDWTSEKDGYNEAKVGVATSSSVCGDYTYHGSFQPGGLESRDMTVFQDTDGKAYLITEQRGDGSTGIYLLKPDYLSVDKRVHYWKEQRESPAMIKSNGVYFLFVSHPDWWNPSDNFYSTSTSISGPWSPWKKFAKEGTNTYQSQVNFVLPIGNDKFIYMGDRWHGPWQLMRSTYVWLPLEISGTTARMENYDSWSVDVETGVMTPGPKGQLYEAESADKHDSVTELSCSGCSGGKMVGDIERGNGTLTFKNIVSHTRTRTTLMIMAPNNDWFPRYATVSVNGVEQTVSFLRSESYVTPLASAVHVTLEKCAWNTIVISGAGNGPAPTIDAIRVLEPEGDSSTSHKDLSARLFGARERIPDW
ncbi:hypothetical protein FRC06_006599, partial [Ceratobasidium sp. 370]